MYTDTDVIIVGAGPAGLMLAAELRLAGASPIVLEKHVDPGTTPNANGLGGQIMPLLGHRGLLERFAAVAVDASPTPIYPFGGVHIDLSALADPPLEGMQLRHPSVERLLEEHVTALGAEVRRGQEVTGVRQDGESVTAEVRGPHGPHELKARYLVGCDGGRSRVRVLAGIPFPGTTYPDVNRLAELTVPDGVTLLENGDLEVPGVGTVAAGFTRTDRGVFAFGALSPEVLMINTIEDEATEYDDEPMSLAELGESIRRVLGIDLPLGEPLRISRYQHKARQAERYRDGRILLAGDAAHLLPATGAARSLGMLDSVNLGWKLAAALRGDAPGGLLDTYESERHLAGSRALLQTQAQVAPRRGHDAAADALRVVFQELLVDEQPARRLAALIAGADTRYPMPGAADAPHPIIGTFVPRLALERGNAAARYAEAMRAARPVLLELAGRASLREAAGGWQGRVEVIAAQVDDAPADALLIRPDAHIAWAVAEDEPDGIAVPAVQSALRSWFGDPTDPA